MIESKRFLVLPLTPKGLENFEYCVYDEPDVKTIVMPEKEFEYIYPNISEPFNQENGTLLDCGEQEDVPFEKLVRLRELLDERMAPVTCGVIDQAIELKMPLAFEW